MNVLTPYLQMYYNYSVIEGNIGSGKTTLVNRLSKEFGCKPLLERFNDNPFLAKFYQDKKRYAFQVELSFLADRYDHLKKELAPDLFTPKTIADYFIDKCRIFSHNNLQEDELQLFLNLFSIINSTLPKPDVIFYLYLKSETLLKNIGKRGRAYESAISKEYLDSIHAAYFKHFKQLKDCKVVIVDTNNIDFVKNETDYQKLKTILTDKYPNGISRIIV